MASVPDCLIMCVWRWFNIACTSWFDTLVIHIFNRRFWLRILLCSKSTLLFYLMFLSLLLAFPLQWFMHTWFSPLGGGLVKTMLFLWRNEIFLLAFKKTRLIRMLDFRNEMLPFFFLFSTRCFIFLVPIMAEHTVFLFLWYFYVPLKANYQLILNYKRRLFSYSYSMAQKLFRH